MAPKTSCEHLTVQGQEQNSLTSEIEDWAERSQQIKPKYAKGFTDRSIRLGKVKSAPLIEHQ